MTHQSDVHKNKLDHKNEQKKSIMWRSPDVDLYENSDELVLHADLPGVVEEGVQVEVSRGVLTLQAVPVSAETAGRHGYYRQFTLSSWIDADAGTAALEDGVLTLRLPKSEAAKPKRIAVQTLH